MAVPAAPDDGRGEPEDHPAPAGRAGAGGVAAALGALALTAATGAASAEELYKFTPAPAREPNRFAAIAYSPSTAKWGYAYDRSIASFVRKDALKNCKADDAQVVVVAGNMWCALALGDDKAAYGVGTGGSADIAARLALRAARGRTTRCTVAVCVHSKVGKGR
jgi:hypothetical protein